MNMPKLDSSLGILEFNNVLSWLVRVGKNHRDHHDGCLDQQPHYHAGYVRRRLISRM